MVSAMVPLATDAPLKVSWQERKHSAQHKGLTNPAHLDLDEGRTPRYTRWASEDSTPLRWIKCVFTRLFLGLSPPRISEGIEGAIICITHRDVELRVTRCLREQSWGFLGSQTCLCPDPSWQLPAFPEADGRGAPTKRLWRPMLQFPW